jgi:hypothetical protein
VKRLPLEIPVVWLLFAVVGAELVVTYARFDAGELYNVSGSGLRGGASRLLVFLNFPLALVAIAVLLLLAERAPRAAAAGIALSAAVFWPGVVDPADLDARPVNALAACGVAIALATTVLVWRRLGRERALDRAAAWLRAAIAVAVLVVAVPWIAAESGVSFAGVPGLGTLYQTTELRTQPGSPAPHPAVHHGHHHGMDGALLVWTALLLLPAATLLARRWLALLTTAYLALMLCYGAALVLNDAWLEQVVKRGWTDRVIPNALQPSLSAIWAIVIAATVVLVVVLVPRGDAEKRAR